MCPSDWFFKTVVKLLLKFVISFILKINGVLAPQIH